MKKVAVICSGIFETLAADYLNKPLPWVI